MPFLRLFEIRAILVLCAVVSGALWGPPARAAEGLTLQQVIEATLESSIGVRLARSQVRAGEGDLLSARSLYDPVFTTSGSHASTADPSLTAGADTRDSSSTFALDLSQEFRSGWQLIPNLVVNRSDLDGSPAFSTGTVGVRAVVPLLEGRGGKDGRFRLKAAEVAYEGDRRNLSHQGALSVFDAVVAYWNYVGAHRSLEVSRVSEQRADDLVSEMQQLVEGEERPAADLIQVQGNAAVKRIIRISAEQTVVSARRRLGLSMGITGPAMERLQPPSDLFPKAEPFSGDPATVAGLVAMAVEQRADLQAQSLLEDSARWSVEATDHDLKPTLDLTLSAGYSGIDAGGGLGQAFGALGNNIAGVSTSVLVSYQLPWRNEADRGRALRSRSNLEQQEILTEDLERRVWSAVMVAAEAVERGALQAIEAERAVSLSRTTVANEKTKIQLGLATLFDVILAEDNLTSAELTEVAARQAYATALATLRFETGSLVSDSGTATFSVDAASLTQPPVADPPTGHPATATGGEDGGSETH